MIKVSDYIVKFLEDIGVKHVFMVSGGGCIHLVDSIGKSKKIKYICNLHEQGAGIAAEAYSQYANDLGVVLVTTGPGSTNVITPIAGAWLDSIPLLVIAGQVSTKDKSDGTIRQKGFQEINIVDIVKPITKLSLSITNPRQIKIILDYAFVTAKFGRSGPVLIEVPLDIQSTMIDETTLDEDINVHRNEYLENSLSYKIDNVISLLNESKRPILLVGNGVRLASALDSFYKFIEKIKIPVLTTWKAIDFLEEDHPLFVGRPGAFGQRGANINQQNSDLIICVGARLDHGQLAYQPKYFARNAKKIIVDIDMFELHKNDKTMNVDMQIREDAGMFFDNLINHIDEIKIDTTEWLNKCKEIYNKYPVVLSEYYKRSNVNPYVFINELSKVLPENSLVIPGSSGTCSEVTMQAIKLKKGTRIFNTEGLGSMGYGIPAAIGGCIASGNKQTICIDGDGGFFMNIQELEVVRRLDLPIIFFVLNNNGYGAIQTTQKTHFNGFFVGSSPDSGLTLPSIEKNAEAYNIPYIKISSHKELLESLSIILNSTYPIICELIIDPLHEALPRTVVTKNENGEFETAPMEIMKPLLSDEELKSNLI